MFGFLSKYLSGAPQKPNQNSMPVSANQPASSTVGDSEKQRFRIPPTCTPPSSNLSHHKTSKHHLGRLRQPPHHHHPPGRLRKQRHRLETHGEGVGQGTEAEKGRPLHDGLRAFTDATAAEGLLENMRRFLSGEAAAGEKQTKMATEEGVKDKIANAEMSHTAALPHSNTSGDPGSIVSEAGRSDARSPSPSMASQTSSPSEGTKTPTHDENTEMTIPTASSHSNASAEPDIDTSHAVPSGAPSPSPSIASTVLSHAHGLNSDTPSHNPDPPKYMLDPENIEVLRLRLQIATVEKRLEEDVRHGDEAGLDAELKREVREKVQNFKKMLKWEAEGVDHGEVEESMIFIGTELRVLLERMRAPRRRVVGGEGGENTGTQEGEREAAAQDTGPDAEVLMVESVLLGSESSFVHVGKPEADEEEEDVKVEPKDDTESDLDTTELNEVTADVSPNQTNDQKVHLTVDEESEYVDQVQDVLQDTEPPNQRSEESVQNPSDSPDSCFNTNVLGTIINDFDVVLESIDTEPSHHQSEAPAQDIKSPRHGHDDSAQSASNSDNSQRPQVSPELPLDQFEDFLEDNERPSYRSEAVAQDSSRLRVNQSQRTSRDLGRSSLRIEALTSNSSSLHLLGVKKPHQIVDLTGHENSDICALVPADTSADHEEDSTGRDELEDNEYPDASFIGYPEGPRGGIEPLMFEVIEPQRANAEELDDPQASQSSEQVDAQVSALEQASSPENADQVPEADVSEQVNNQISSADYASPAKTADRFPEPKASEHVDNQVSRPEHASLTNSADHFPESDPSEQTNNKVLTLESDDSDSSNESKLFSPPFRYRFVRRAARGPRRPPPVPVSAPADDPTRNNDAVIQDLASIDLLRINEQLALMERRHEEETARRASEDLNLYDFLHQQAEQKQKQNCEDPTQPTTPTEAAAPIPEPKKPEATTTVPGTWHDSTDSEHEERQYTQPPSPGPAPQVRARLSASLEKLGWSPETKGKWPIIVNKRKKAPPKPKAKALWRSLLTVVIRAIRLVVFVGKAVLLLIGIALAVMWMMGIGVENLGEYLQRSGYRMDTEGWWRKSYEL